MSEKQELLKLSFLVKSFEICLSLFCQITSNWIFYWYSSCQKLSVSVNFGTMLKAIKSSQFAIFDI